MNEGFSSQKKKIEKPNVSTTEGEPIINSQEGFLEEEQSKEKPLWMKYSSGILDKCKKFIEKKSLNLKLGVALVVALGSIEVAQGQDMSTYNNSIEDVKSGKLKIENVVDNIFNSYKEANIDSTFSILEHISSRKNGEYIDRGGFQLSGAVIPFGNTQDTISLGDVEVKSFWVQMRNYSHVWEDSEQSFESESEWRFLSGIKTHVNNNDFDSHQGKEIKINYGETPQIAIRFALDDIAQGRKVYVSSSADIVKSKSKEGKLGSSSEIFISLDTGETNEIIENVKIIVQKMSERETKKHLKESMVHGKEARKYNRGRNKEDYINTRIKNKDIPQKYYSVKVIYNK